MVANHRPSLAPGRSSCRSPFAMVSPINSEICTVRAAARAPSTTLKINIDMRTSRYPVAAAPAVSAAAASRRIASRVSFMVCSSAALAFNLVAIGVFAAVTTPRHSTPANGARTAWITATKIQPPPETIAPASEPARTAPPATLHEPTPAAATEHPSLPARTPRPMVETPVLPPVLLSPTPPTANTEGEPMRFYGSGEVDQPAEPAPDSDWNLDTAALDAWGVRALVFDVFISRTGEVIESRIIEPQSLPDAARLALQQRVRETAVQPALRDQIPVASVRRIEMSVAPPGL